MKFYRKLYVSESLKKRQDKIIEKLNEGKGSLGCYVISFTANPSNQLEFYDSMFLFQKSYAKESLFVVGLAGCYEEALEVVKSITEDAYRARHDANLREYIIEQQGSRI